MNLHQFWFRFRNAPLHSPLGLGCGVTAYSHEDALALLDATIFAGGEALHVELVIEDVQIDELDHGDAVAGQDVASIRGVWFPKGYQPV